MLFFLGKVFAFSLWMTVILNALACHASCYLAQRSRCKLVSSPAFKWPNFLHCRFDSMRQAMDKDKSVDKVLGFIDCLTVEFNAREPFKY